MAVAYGETAPLPGAGGMTDADWRQIGTAWGDGIVNDHDPAGTNKFGITKPPASRTLTLTLGEYRIRGYHFIPSAASIPLTIPDVPSGQTRRDRLVARFDVTPEPQVSFYIKTGTAVPTTSTAAYPSLTKTPGGAWEYSLHAWSGGNDAAADLTYIDDRHWVAPTIYRFGVNLPEATQFPYGTRLILNRGVWVEEFIRQTRNGNEPYWLSLDAPDWVTIPFAGAPGTLGVQGTTAPRCTMDRGWVVLDGAVNRSSGAVLAAANTGAIVGTLPEAFWPATPVTQQVAASTAFDARLTVSTAGVITITPAQDITWASLEGVRFYHGG